MKLRIALMLIVSVASASAFADSQWKLASSQVSEPENPCPSVVSFEKSGSDIHLYEWINGEQLTLAEFTSLGAGPICNNLSGGDGDSPSVQCTENSMQGSTYTQNICVSKGIFGALAHDCNPAHDPEWTTTFSIDGNSLSYSNNEKTYNWMKCQYVPR